MIQAKFFDDRVLVDLNKEMGQVQNMGILLLKFISYYFSFNITVLKHIKSQLLSFIIFHSFQTYIIGVFLTKDPQSI